MGMEFLIPLLLSAGMSAIGGGFSAWQRSRENRSAAQAQQRRAASLEEAIERMYSTDVTSPLVARAFGDIGGGFAAAGLGSSGMTNHAMAEAAAGIRAEDLARKNAMEMQIRQDSSFGGYSVDDFNPFLDAVIGALGGAAAGAGSAYGAYLGTEAGASNPFPWQGAKASTAMPSTGPTGQFTVGLPPVTAYDYRPAATQPRRAAPTFGVRF